MIPALRSWADPRGVDPITDVLPMAGLRNSLAHPSRPGVFPAGDALAHTDPTLAHGLAFALIHAVALGDALEGHTDAGDAWAAYLAATLPAVTERYEFATALDAERLRMWLGEPVDFTRPDGDYALFTMVSGAMAAATDPEAFRVFNRRIGLLDGTGVLDGDKALQRHIADRAAELRARPQQPSGPTRSQLRDAIRPT
jgi:hypothetical protein